MNRELAADTIIAQPVYCAVSMPERFRSVL
jgi:hypothetical protein